MMTFGKTWWCHPAVPLAMFLFLAPFAATVALDTIFLERKYYHHLGDYSGVFSLGIGWLEGAPYKNFPWPLWGVSQVSAVMTLIVGMPTTSLKAFNAGWILLNCSAAIFSAWLLARVLRNENLPCWFALGLGFVTFTMPVTSTGWITSNPYFPFGTILGPASVILIRKLSVPTEPLKFYEAAGLGALGFIVANNFGAATVFSSAAIAYAVMMHLDRWGRKLVSNGNYEAEPMPDRVDLVYLVLVSFFVASIAFGCTYHILNDRRGLVVISTIAIVIAVGVSSWTLRARLGAPQRGVQTAVIALLTGWLLGSNFYAFEYGRVALVAIETASAPKRFLPNGFWPTLDWGNLSGGAYWYWFLGIGFLAAVLLLIAGVCTRASEKRICSMTAAAFSLTLFYSILAITGWDFTLPMRSSLGSYGLAGRYLWTGLAVVFVPIITIAILVKSVPITRWLVVLLISLGTISLNQGVQAKRYIKDRIDETITYTDEQANRHLGASLRNVVLVANAYFPERAMVLYAYHNSRVGIYDIKLEDLEGGRIVYIGRYRGALWKSPLDIMKERRLKPEEVLIVAEGADYPEFMEVVRGFHETDTYIMRIKAGSVY